MSDKVIIPVVGVIACMVTLFVGSRWHIDLLTSKHGLNGGWGFEIFIAVFAAIYVPAALLRRARHRRKLQKTADGGGTP